MTICIAYATGLLVARRALTKLGLADKYEGVTEPNGTLTLTEELDDEDAPRPFKAYLDVGLKRTSTGSRVFGALKGASDGGIFIPHSDKRFPGYDPETKALDSEILKKYIFGGHVAEYMESLEEEDDERLVSLSTSQDLKRRTCITDSRNNSRPTSQTAWAQKISKRYTKMATLPSGKTPYSSPQKKGKTGKQSRSNTRYLDAHILNARRQSRRRSRHSRQVGTLLRKTRRTMSRCIPLTMFLSILCIQKALCTRYHGHAVIPADEITSFQGNGILLIA